jgi:hypothetical protein
LTLFGFARTISGFDVRLTEATIVSKRPPQGLEGSRGQKLPGDLFWIFAELGKTVADMPPPRGSKSDSEREIISICIELSSLPTNWMLCSFNSQIAMHPTATWTYNF